MKDNEYKICDGFIRRLIDQRKNFFLGACGIGVKITRDVNDYGWDLYLERARLALYADELEVKDGKLILSVEGGYSIYGDLELAHYLKVTVSL